MSVCLVADLCASTFNTYVTTIFVLCVLPSILCQSCAPYDQLVDDQGNIHTMCLYAPDSGCPKIMRGVTDQDIADILQSHNKYRMTIARGQQGSQPSASNMKQLKWNHELATIAQRLVDQCQFEHDQNRNTQTFPQVGQNFAQSITPIDDGTDANFPNNAISGWYSEVNKFSSASINPFVYNTQTGHYTQVAWANTTDIGCGFAYFTQDSNYIKSYVCNYGYAGNFDKDAMYIIGNACDNCINGYSTDYPGLCK